jgi:hypothetical protein
MSSRKAATAKTAKAATAKVAVRRRAATTRPAVKPAAKIVADKADKNPTDGTASAEALQLAAKIERDLREGRLDTLTPQAFQTLMAALCKSYGTQLEAGASFLPVADRNSVTPTEIMTTTSSLLKAANLAVFELGMWQSWTGR